MNSKYVLFLFSAAVFSVAACALPQMSGEPDLSPVRVISTPPPADCKFVAGILGDYNGGDPGRFMTVETMTGQIRSDLQNNAARLGGNVVLLRGAYMGKPDVSNDYFRPFYINDIAYNAVVYNCP